ncbi:MAG: hypothetical protein K5923_06065 [Clostridia bacterium]|nr:hypothetical protein [Clostridia bacterium]
MKKRFLLIVSVIALIVCATTMLFACSSSDKFEGKTYEKMESYYADALKSVKKCEETLDALVGNVKASSFTANFSLERTYYSTADDNKAFMGDMEKGGYNDNDKVDDTKWLVDAVDYEFKYNNGDYKITAKVYPTVASDDYNAKNKGEVKSTYVYTKRGELVICEPADEAETVAKYCYDMVFDVIFGQFTEDEFLESYCESATKGFRFVTSMMQYQMVRAFKYADDGTISNEVIKYSENKDKIVYSALEEVYSDGKLSYRYNGEPKDIKGDDISYWEAYGEDITYNLNKVAAIYNDRVTMTYKNKSKQLNTYEYYGEKVLPFYRQKSDFKTYKVLKAVVADYTHFTVEFNYETVEI